MAIIELKHRRTGDIIKIQESQSKALHIINNYDIITSAKDVDGDGIPDDNWTKKDITAYLRAKGIAYKSSYNKAKLLGMC